MNKFLNLVSGENTATQEKNDWRIANREQLRESQQFAINLLEKLDEVGWTVEFLAEKTKLPIQTIVKGQTLTTPEQMEIIDDAFEHPYCFYCMACGIEGCCPPTQCKQDPDGEYCESYLRQLKETYIFNNKLVNFILDNKEKYPELEQFIDNEL